MKKQIVIADQLFLSMSDAKTYIKDYLLKKEPNKIFEDDFLTALIELHPDQKYRGKSPKFLVELSPCKSFGHLWMIYGDKRHRISWNKCIGLKKETASGRLRDAMRAAIYPQLPRFPLGTPCEACGSRVGPFHVDHHPGLFKDLVAAFITKTLLPTPTEFDDEQRGGCRFRREDWVFEDAWAKFHLSHARYRKLCATCNTSHKHEVKSV